MELILILTVVGAGVGAILGSGSAAIGEGAKDAMKIVARAAGFSLLAYTAFVILRKKK